MEEMHDNRSEGKFNRFFLHRATIREIFEIFEQPEKI